MLNLILNSAVFAALVGLIGVIITYIAKQRQQRLIKQCDYYAEYVKCVMRLKREKNEINCQAYELARVNLLLLGSCDFISRMYDYESLLVGQWDCLSELDTAERAIILQGRRDLGLSNNSFPESLYLFTIK